MPVLLQELLSDQLAQLAGVLGPLLFAGELAFLLASGTMELRLYKAGGVVLGYVSHLVLDELYSIEWYRGRLRFKKTLGSALKLFSRRWWPNVSTFATLAILTYIVLKEPGWMQQHYQQRIKPTVHQAADAVDRVVR